MKEPSKHTNYIRQKFKKNGSSIWEFEFDTYEAPGEVYYENQNQLPKVKVGKGFVPHGGIFLRNVYNCGFRMAQDIGVVGIYVFPGPKAKENGFKKPKFLILGPPEFIQLDNDTQKPLDPNKVYNPLLEKDKMDYMLESNMATYNNDRERELKVTYRSTYEVFGEGSGYLFVTQKFILTKYSDKPAHEPTGGLKAARLFPITKLKYNVPEKSKYKIEDYVESFRVDYRLHINLDTYAISKAKANSNSLGYSEKLIYDRKKINSKIINNVAGLFKDEDNMNFAYGAGGGVANVIFSATEKPLVSEIVTEGLNPYSDKQHLKWDNIHWWGIGKDGILGSTPGSFHAVHIHWRWAKNMQNKKKFYEAYKPKHTGEPQFAGKGDKGELIDPYIKKQILRLAVIKNEGLPQNYHEHRSIDFKDFFINLRENKLPADLNGGKDIILYYSSEVKLKDAKKTLNGALICSIFVHGLFFAHEIEQNLTTTGTTDAFYVNPKNPKSKEWERYPGK